MVRCLWKYIVQGAAADNIVNISQGPRDKLGSASDNKGKAEACVIYSSMNTAASEILLDI